MSDTILDRISRIGGYALNGMVAIGAAFQEALEKAKKESYSQGFDDGERQAREELAAFKKQLAGLIDKPQTITHETNPAPQIERAVPLENEQRARRSPRGSVEPKVFGAICDSVKGKKPSEIAAETGVPENSVRGMLNKLRKDGRVFKVGDVWRPSAPVPQPDGSTVRVTPEGFLISTPANLVGSGNPGAGAPGPINKAT